MVKGKKKKGIKSEFCIPKNYLSKMKGKYIFSQANTYFLRQTKPQGIQLQEVLVSKKCERNFFKLKQNYVRLKLWSKQ